MDLIRKIPKKFTKKFGSKVINRQYFYRKTGLKSHSLFVPILSFLTTIQPIIRFINWLTTSGIIKSGKYSLVANLII